MKDKKLAGWKGGAHNLSERVPEGYLLDAVNVDPTDSGELALRPGIDQLYSGNKAKGLLALGDKLLFVNDGNLVEFNTTTNSSRVLRSIAGGLCGDVLNDRLYFCSGNEALEYDGQSVRPWGVPDVLFQPGVATQAGGSLLPGHYQVAMTYTDAWGREGGTDKPVVLRAEGSLSVSVPAPPGGCTANIYVGSVNGETLYLQATSAIAQDVVVSSLRDDTAALATAMLRRPPVGHRVVAHNGVLVIAAGSVLQVTTPMRPHFVDRVRGFVQYPRRIGAVMSNRAQVFVSADRSYVISDIEAPSIVQRSLAEYPAAEGTETRLPDGRCAWMTQYGQAISNAAGGLDLPNQSHYAPALGTSGAAGVVDNNGNQMIVTAMHGRNSANRLTASDFLTGEVLNP